MKRFLLSLVLSGLAIPSLFANGWNTAARGLYVATREPEKTASVVEFLMALFLMAIPVAIVAGIVTMILRSVFSLDKDETARTFLVIGGILLAICLICYVVA